MMTDLFQGLADSVTNAHTKMFQAHEVELMSPDNRRVYVHIAPSRVDDP